MGNRIKNWNHHPVLVVSIRLPETVLQGIQQELDHRNAVNSLFLARYKYPSICIPVGAHGVVWIVSFNPTPVP